MITDKRELDYCLRRWGRAFGEHPPQPDDEMDDAVASTLAQSAVNTLAELAQFRAPKRASESEAARRKEFFGRSVARRIVSGKAAGLADAKGNAMPAPAWANDPIRGRQTNSGGAPWSPDPVAEMVERAVLQLYRFDRVMATCIRVEYCTLAHGLHERVARAAHYLELKLPTREYRKGVDHARVWLAGKLS